MFALRALIDLIRCPVCKRRECYLDLLPVTRGRHGTYLLLMDRYSCLYFAESAAQSSFFEYCSSFEGPISPYSVFSSYFS